MWRFVVFSVLVLTVCAVSGGTSSESSEKSTKSKIKSYKKVCGNKLSEDSTCDNGYWTGFCVASKDKSGSKKPICRQACTAAPEQPDQSANVELVGTYDPQNAWEGAELAVKCKTGFEAAAGSSMKLTCVNGAWSKFSGKCDKGCGNVPVAPANTEFDNSVGGTTLGGKVTYRCVTGLSSTDPQKHTCTTTGWELSGENCKEPVLTTCTDNIITLSDDQPISWPAHQPGQYTNNFSKCWAYQATPWYLISIVLDINGIECSDGNFDCSKEFENCVDSVAIYDGLDHIATKIVVLQILGVLLEWFVNPTDKLTYIVDISETLSHNSAWLCTAVLRPLLK